MFFPFASFLSFIPLVRSAPSNPSRGGVLVAYRWRSRTFSGLVLLVVELLELPVVVVLQGLVPSRPDCPPCSSEARLPHGAQGLSGNAKVFSHCNASLSTQSLQDSMCAQRYLTFAPHPRHRVARNHLRRSLVIFPTPFSPGRQTRNPPPPRGRERRRGCVRLLSVRSPGVRFRPSAR